jgi:hypothetical protein
MSFMHGLVAISLAAGAVCAQSIPIGVQEAARARQLLRSARWVDKAWGAYLAGRLHSADLEEPLIEELNTAGALANMPSYSEEYAFVAALFDAAIEADITVPATVLEPFEENWSAPVLILLARSKDSEDSLLRLGKEKSRDIVWLAANNLLFEMKSQRWYATMLSEVSITHRFMVTDPHTNWDIASGGGGDGCGGGLTFMPKGFPPITLYTLQQRSKRGSVLLARGPQNVYYERTIVPTDKRVGSGPCASSVSRMAIRIGYLAELANVPVKEVESLFHHQTVILYRDIEGFQREVEQSLKAQEQGIRGLIQAAKKRGMDGASGMRLQIVPEVNDRRRNPAEPLPVITPRVFVLE